MVKFTQKSKQNHTKDYSISLLEVEAIIKKLKESGSDRSCDDLDTISHQADKIIAYMSKPLVYQEQSYSRSLIVLDNMLVLNKEMLFDVRLPTAFMQNLCMYFNHITNMIDDETKVQKIQSALYGCLYLVLLLIYKAGTSEQIKNKLLNKMFKNQFINKFAELPVNECSIKMTRVIAMILTYLVRHKPIVCSNPKLKKMILQLISCCHEQITRAYLAVVLKKMSNWITYSQILKYNVIEFIFDCLENQQGQTIKNALVIVCSILKNYKNLTDKMMKMQLIKHWDLNIKKYPDLCLSIFKLILPFISVEKKQSWFKIYLTHILNNTHKISHTHLEILESLVQHISSNFYFEILEGPYLDKMSQTHELRSLNLDISIKNFKQKFFYRLKQLNQSLFFAYKNWYDRNLQYKLSDLY